MTGNPDTRRDFTDVRDVVRAYRLLAERAEPGRLQRLLRPHGVGQRARGGARRGRAASRSSTWSTRRWCAPHEVMELRGSYERLREATGWEPEIPLERTLADALAWWRA